MKDMTGLRFGMLVVLRREPGTFNDKQIHWRCKCDCGDEHTVGGYSLRKGACRSCGCMERKNLDGTGVRRVHGASASAEYGVWVRMRDRCENPSNNRYKNYGGRGIKVCDRWQGEYGFVNFLADVGKRPSWKYSIDRKNVNRDYEPGNVQWSTELEQARNKTTSKLDAAKVAEIRSRLARGDKGNRIAKDVGVTPSMVCAIKNGRTWKDAA